MHRTLVLIAVLSAGLGWLGRAASGQDLPRFETSLVEIVRKVRPKVVAITSYEKDDGELLKFRFSGIVISAEGHIVTVSEAIKKKERIEVRLLDGRVLEADVVGRDRLTNLGVIKIAAQNLPHVRETGSRQVEPGSFVVAVGNPFGLHHSVGTGIVSGTDRTIRTRDFVFTGMIQTTAPINPGDAGGFLGDSRGRFVGMVTSTFGRAPSYRRIRKILGRWAKEISRDPEFVQKFIEYVIRARFSPPGTEKTEEQKKFEEKVKKIFEKIGREFGGEERSKSEGKEDVASHESAFGAQGINFVMPGHQVLEIARSIMRHGAVVRGYLGARGRAPAFFSETDLAKYGVGKTSRGVLVESVTDEGPAARAGLRPGDLILAIDGRRVDDPDALRLLVFGIKPRARVLLRISRQGALLEISVEMGERK
jgi:serine protease Do